MSPPQSAHGWGQAGLPALRMRMRMRALSGLARAEQSLHSYGSAASPQGYFLLERFKIYREGARFVSICGLIHHLKIDFFDNLLSKLEKVLDFVSPIPFDVRPTFLKNLSIFLKVYGLNKYQVPSSSL